MLLIVFVALYSATLTVTADSAVIEFHAYTTCDQAWSPIVLEDEPLQIRVLNSHSFESGECKDIYGNDIPFTNKQQKFQLFQAKVEHVLSSYGDKWSCTFWKFYYWNSWDYLTCEAQFHLRTKIPVASISINNNQINASRTNLSITTYDAGARYMFEDKETVFIECKPSLASQSGQTTMKYFNSTGGISSEMSGLFENKSIILKLAKEADSSYVDCIINKDMDVSITRLVLQLRNASAAKSNSDISLHINGMYVRPTGAVYQHLYYAGERTDITCHIGNDYFINLDYEGSRISTMSKVNIMINFNKIYNNYSDVVCMALGVNETVRVQFIKSLSDFYVEGLNRGKILQEYRRTEYSSVIYYQYTDNDILTLTCIKTIDNGIANELKWLYNDTSIHSTEERNNNTLKIYLKLPLQESDDNSTIKCIYSATGAPHTNITQQIFIKLTYKITDTKLHKLVLIWVSFIFIIIVIIIVVFVKYFKSKKKKLQQSSEVNNENSPNSGDNPLPHPTQWNEANYTNIQLRESDDNEPDDKNNGNYSNVDYTNRNKETEPALNYADILLVNNDKKIIKKTVAANYSRVQFTDSNTDASNYVNMSEIQGPIYENSYVGEDEVEPTYCEMDLQAHR